MRPPGGLDLTDGRPPRAGPVLLALGVVLVLAGLALGGYGVVRAAQGHGDIGTDAVAYGLVQPGPGSPVSFESTGDEQSVYLDFDGVSGDSHVQDRTAAAVACEVTPADGRVQTLRGARQGTSASVGDYVSVGTFSASAGEISCGYVSASRALPDEVPYVVTPGSTGDATWPVLVILGGVAVLLLGGWAGVAGWSRSRRAARLRSL